MNGIRFSREPNKHTTALFDISLFITETPHGLSCSLEYCTDLFTEATMARLATHFKTLLASVVNQPQEKIGLLPLLGKEEEQQLLEGFNATAAAYPQDKTITQLFEDKAKETPGATALVFEDEHLTYQQLNERSNQVAHYLHSKGIGKETLVPICIERGAEMVIGLLGILKAGATFVPVDPNYPEDRISYMLEDTAAALVVSSRASRSKINTDSTVEVIELDGDAAAITQQPTTNLSGHTDATQLAYVIYTSGSTGKPKGVMIAHTSVVNLLVSMAKDTGFTSESSFMSVTTFSFDICYLELFMPLVQGGQLIVVPTGDSDGWLRPSSSHCTPATYAFTGHAFYLADIGRCGLEKEGLKMLTGGEALKDTLKNELTARGEVWNGYGPTETTIYSTIKKLHPTEKVSIGQPIANTQVQIVSREGALVPVGVAGELLIGGAVLHAAITATGADGREIY